MDSDTISDLANVFYGILTDWQFVSYDLVPVVLESLAFGCYTLLAICTFVQTFWTRRTVKSRKTVLLVFCAVMYAAASAHFGITLSCLLRDNKRAAEIRAAMLDCMEDIAQNPHACSGSEPLATMFNSVAFQNSAVMPLNPELTALVAMNMLLSDIVVLWRAWVLWPRRRTIQILSVFSVGVSLAMLAWAAGLQKGLRTWIPAIAIVMSWVTNILATTLVAFKAWQHRCQVGALLRDGSGRTRAEVVLLLFAESGIFYCLLWVPVIASAVVDILAAFNIPYYAPGSEYPAQTLRFLAAMQTVESSCLIDIVGMYPTAVILLVQLSDHYAHRTLSIPTIATRADHAAAVRTGQPATFVVSLSERRDATESDDDLRCQYVLASAPLSPHDPAAGEKIFAEV
ncbi:hypothetical protein PsYK624_033070 [Phanerochaete sordida]|uniref:Uncharacterized protein n=1 Tax=Phanerochaete sordida TaxID=48140 RepID=A0A9P3G3J6_9APHY|nr:hypothetical protein PsYK624_033070 [Phanerochaete sordida]